MNKQQYQKHIEKEYRQREALRRTHSVVRGWTRSLCCCIPSSPHETLGKQPPRSLVASLPPGASLPPRAIRRLVRGFFRSLSLACVLTSGRGCYRCSCCYSYRFYYCCEMRGSRFGARKEERGVLAHLSQLWMS